jgi:hypothetical protein
VVVGGLVVVERGGSVVVVGGLVVVAGAVVSVGSAVVPGGSIVVDGVAVVGVAVVAGAAEVGAADAGGSPPGGSAFSPDRDAVQAPRTSTAVTPPTSAAIDRTCTGSLYGPQGGEHRHPTANNRSVSRDVRPGGS